MKSEAGQRLLDLVTKAVEEEKEKELRIKINKHETALNMVLEQLYEAKQDIVNAVSDMPAKEIADGGLDSYVEEIRFCFRRVEMLRVKIETMIEIIGSDDE